MTDKGIAPKRSPVGFLWIWTIFWCAVSFPMTWMAWTQPASWGTRLFMIPFVLIGLGALYYTLQLHQKSMLSRGVKLVLSDWKPRAGEALHAELLLPANGRRSAWLQSSSLTLQLVQYEEDRSGSGISLIRSHALEQVVRPEQLTDGSWRLATRFDVPTNAPATGAVRHGNSVVWQIELHDAKQAELVAFVVQLRAAQQPALAWSAAPLNKRETLLLQDAQDHSNERSSSSRWPAADEGEKPFDQQEIASLDIGEQPAAVVRSVARFEENSQLWRAVFPRKAWRVWAIMLATASVAAVWWARHLWHANTGWASLVEGLVVWLLACALIIASLHAWTKRWHLVVRDEGFAVDKSSALFKRAQEFGAIAAQPLRYSLVYQSSTTGQPRIWHFSAVIPEGSYGRKISITPALPGAPTCAAVVHHFWQALTHRRMRFAAPADEVYSGLGPSAGQRLSAWFAALFMAGLFLIFTTLSPKTQPIDVLKPAVIIEQTGQQLQRLHPKTILLSRKHDALLKAHRANQAQQLAQAFSSGADANALDDDGMPLLIDAARSGHLELVRAYLQHGANVNIRHTANPNNHSDTALLVALHRGHWETAQLLLASGADLKAKNRWDWGAMHMAAQSNCIKCLEGLLVLGFSPNEPAPASRGESPVMLAAGRDRLAALRWLVAHGGSLEQKDPHGQNALAWAQFFKRQSTADWIREQLAAPGTKPEITN
jgi:Ankyrin repeats (3 copies)